MPTSFKKYVPRVQDFSIPGNIIYYFLKCQMPPKIREKLIKTCKYFFEKNPVLAIKKIHKWFEDLTFTDFEDKEFDKLLPQIWIIGEINIYYCEETNVITKIIPNIFRCDLNSLRLVKQKISYNEYLFLISSGNVKDLSFNETTVFDSNGIVVGVEKILERVPQIKMFSYDFPEKSNSFFNNETFAKLLELPPFEYLEMLYLCNFYIPTNSKSIQDFNKKNSKAFLWLNPDKMEET